MPDRYDELTKGAFNTWKSVDIQAALNAPSFEKGVVSILESAGVPNAYLRGVAGEEPGADDWLDVFRDFASSITDFAVDAGVAGLVTAMGWGEFVPLVETAVSNVRGDWRNARDSAALGAAATLVPGSWVYINNGREEVMVDKDELRRRLVEIPDPEDRISMGFFVGVGERAGTVQVFNFEVFRVERVKVDDVWPVDSKVRAILERNEVMTAIRDLKFTPDPQPRMESKVPTDPGTEVVFNKELYHIVQCESGIALIEDTHGQRLTVSLDKLQPGRIEHTNSWNYRKGEPFLSGFDGGSAAPIYSGQWVWVDAREGLVTAGMTTRELAVVWKIGNDGVHAVYALDGETAVVQEVWPCGEDFADSVNLMKNAVNFKLEVLEGGDTKRHNLGQYDLFLCIGKSHDAQLKNISTDTPGESVTPFGAREQETVGDVATRDTVDAQVEVQQRTGIPMKDAAPDPDPGGYETEVAADSYQGGNSLFGYIVMGGLALFILNSVDMNLNILA